MEHYLRRQGENLICIQKLEMKFNVLCRIYLEAGMSQMHTLEASVSISVSWSVFTTL